MGAAVVVTTTSVVVTSATVAGDVGSVVTAPVEHPASNAHMTIAFRRPAIVGQPRTSDLPLCVMKRLACVAMGIAMLAAGCSVDEGDVDLADPGSPRHSEQHRAANDSAATTTTVAAPVEQVATSTIALPAGACVFSRANPASEVTFEVGTRLYSVVPGTARQRV